MDKFYIITNSDKDKNLEITKKIEDYLKAKGKEAQKFVLENKNFSKQGKKVIEFIDSIVKEEKYCKR